MKLLSLFIRSGQDDARVPKRDDGSRTRVYHVKLVILIAIALSLLPGSAAANGDTVISRMATHAPSDFQRIFNTSDSRLPTLPLQLGFTHMPVPPSEFSAAVSTARGGSGSSNQLTSVRADLNASLRNGKWKNTCDGAAWHLLVFLRHLKDKSNDDWQALRWGRPDLIEGYNLISPDEIKDDFRTIMDVYDDKCLDSPDLDSLDSHEHSTGVLLDEGVPYCTASRVSPFHVLTARHCLFWLGYEQTKVVAAFLNAPNRTWELHRLSGETDPWSIADLVRHGDIHFQSYGTYEPMDFDILEPPDGSFSSTSVEFDTGEARTGDQVRILAHNNYVRAYLHIVRGSAPSWQDAMRYDTQSSCRVELFRYEDDDLNQACLIHGCQTAPSSSGAAVVRDGYVLGVHINENDGAGCASALKFVGNRGVRKWKEFDVVRSAILDDGARHLQ